MSEEGLEIEEEVRGGMRGGERGGEGTEEGRVGEGRREEEEREEGTGKGVWASLVHVRVQVPDIVSHDSME